MGRKKVEESASDIDLDVAMLVSHGIDEAEARALSADDRLALLDKVHPMAAGAMEPGQEPLKAVQDADSVEAASDPEPDAPHTEGSEPEVVKLALDFGSAPPPSDQNHGFVAHMELYLEEFAGKAREAADKVDGGIEAIIEAVTAKLRG